MEIELIFAWYDLWIGVFIDRQKSRAYVFPVPMVGLMISWAARGDYEQGEEREMKTLLIAFAFAAALSAQVATDNVYLGNPCDKSVRFSAVDNPAKETLPRYWDLAAGPQLDVLGGMSFKNPGVGGFARLDVAADRFRLINTFRATNDKKAYEPDGHYLENMTEVGITFKRFTPEALVLWGSQYNSVYRKAALGFGGGVRVPIQPGWEAYFLYKAPDVLSFNHTQDIIGGIDVRVSKHWYAGGSGTIVLFKQPRIGGAIDTLAGMEVQARVGYVLGGRER